MIAAEPAEWWQIASVIAGAVVVYGTALWLIVRPDCGVKGCPRRRSGEFHTHP